MAQVRVRFDLRSIPAPLRRASRRLVFACAVACVLANAARAQDAGALRIAAVEPPAVLEQQQPPYPAGAVGSGARGDVGVNVDIDVQGNVTGVSLVRGVAPPLVRAALEAASHWRFLTRAPRQRRSAEPDPDPVPLRAARSRVGSAGGAVPGRRRADSAPHAHRWAHAARATTAGGARRDCARPSAAAEPRSLGFPAPRRRARRRTARQCVRAAEARAWDPADQRGRRGPRRAGLHARLRRA